MLCPAGPYYYMLLTLKSFKKPRDLRRKFRRPQSQPRQLLKACVNSQQGRKERSKRTNRRYAIHDEIHSYIKLFQTIAQVLVQHRRTTKVEGNTFLPHQCTHTEKQNTFFCQNSHRSGLTRAEKGDFSITWTLWVFHHYLSGQMVLQVLNHLR